MAENQIDEKIESFKAQAQEIIDQLGVKVNYLSEEAAKKVVDWKATQDTATRREVRKYWSIIACVAFLVGIGVGILFF